MNKELKFLLHLLYLQITPISEEVVDQYQSVDFSWDRFISLVIRHRVVTVIYLKLKSLGITLPNEEGEKLKYHFELERKKNFILNASLIKLNEILEKEVKVLWFKGVLQSQRMYDNPLVRSYSDLDLYIDKSDLKKVDVLLREEGYEPLMDWTKYSASHFSKYSEFIKEMAYIHQKTKVCIDVHWDLVMSFELFPFTFEDVYQSASEFLIHNKKIKSLNEYHNFIYLNIHGCFDHWKYLAQLFDVTVSLYKYPNLKDDFEVYLKMQKLDKSLLLGIEFSDVLFHNKQSQNPEIIKLLAQFEISNFEESEGKLERLNYFKRHWRYHKSWNYRINCFESNFFYGDNEDLWRLPRSLFFLYYVSVPFRWLGRKIRRKK